MALSLEELAAHCMEMIGAIRGKGDPWCMRRWN